MDSIIIKARENKYVETLLGRRRYLRDIDSRNYTLRSFAERNAINSPIQGSAADIIKLAMISIQQKLLTQNKSRTKMIMQVHDELVFDVCEHELEAIEYLEKTMEEVVRMKVPLTVDVGVGNTWLEAH